MNPDFPQNEREMLEAKLTALLLGELMADEAIEMGKAMERDPELAALYERLKVTIGLVRESASHPAAETAAQTASLKLSEERREKLLAQFKTIAPKEFEKPRRALDWLIPAVAVAAVFMVLAALLLPSLSKSKSRAMRMVNNQEPSTAAPVEAPRVVTVAPAAPPVPEIALPVGNQLALNQSAGEANNGWIGVPESRPSPLTNSGFVSRYGYIALPPGQTLDVDAIHQQATAEVANTDVMTLNYAAASDIREPLTKLYDTNLIAGVSGKFDDKVPILGDVPIVGSLSRDQTKLADANERYYTGSTYRNLSQLGYVVTNGVVASEPASVNTSWGLNNPQTGFGGGGAGGRAFAAGRVMGPIADDSAGAANRKAEIVLPGLTSIVGEKKQLTIDSDGKAASQLVQDGKMMFQLGKLDEADTKLKEALDRDPNNQAALYYESLLKQSRVRQVVDAGRVTSMERTVQAGGGDIRVTNAVGPVAALGVEHTLGAPARTPAEAQQSDAALPKPAVPPPTPQPEILTRENAFSTFSLNVSDVSFKLAAASLEKGQMPEPASIRSEEFINAFDYRDPDAAPGVPIAFAAEHARYPFAHNRELLRFSLKTAAAGRQAGRALNIVLLLDNSGSMERADRVQIIREALRVLAGQLQASDTFSIVTFARTARLRVDGVPGSQAAAAAEEIAKLTPEGGTNLGDALDLAYETALHHYLANGDNRVVLLTDGAANLGDVEPDTLKQNVEAHRKQGVALDCFGIGWEGYNDDLLEVLTRHGDGRYGFINTPEEANTQFVSQIAGALHVAAADVKVQIEFNPRRVTSYRQIGYAKHQLTKEQFRDNTVDAAEIAAQEAGNALYTVETNPQGEGPIATVRVRYKVPGTSEYREQAWDVPYTGSAVAMEQASPAMRLAATASAFSEWLATSPFAAEVTTDDLLKYLNGVPQVYGADARPHKLEWMIRQAKSISGK